uniref:Uncharacterized protein n=2 Tax=Knipowitschia caucasica TaxID=637954 RepID=A0AAV2J0F5_KNICA
MNGPGCWEATSRPFWGEVGGGAGGAWSCRRFYAIGRITLSAPAKADAGGGLLAFLQPLVLRVCKLCCVVPSLGLLLFLLRSPIRRSRQSRLKQKVAAIVGSLVAAPLALIWLGCGGGSSASGRSCIAIGTMRPWESGGGGVSRVRLTLLGCVGWGDNGCGSGYKEARGVSDRDGGPPAVHSVRNGQTEFRGVLGHLQLWGGGVSERHQQDFLHHSPLMSGAVGCGAGGSGLGCVGLLKRK